jgi:hypothetical protein
MSRLLAVNHHPLGILLPLSTLNFFFPALLLLGNFGPTVETVYASCARHRGPSKWDYA